MQIVAFRLLAYAALAGWLAVGAAAAASGAVWPQGDQGAVDRPGPYFTAGWYVGCGIDSAGGLQCWGNNTHGQRNPPSGLTWTAVSGGDKHVCGITRAADLRCWGDNSAGQSTVPSLPSGQTWAAVSTKYNHSCGISRSGDLRCWGSNKMDNGTVVYQTVVPSLPSGQTWAAVSAGFDHTCGLTSAGSIACWGANWQKQCDVPTLPSDRTWVAVSSGNTHTCGIDSAGSMQCWGEDLGGQATVPALPSGRTWAAVAASWVHTCGLDSAGGLQCWGVKEKDNTGQTEVPALPSGRAWAAISAAGLYSCGLFNNGDLSCWGVKIDDFGQTRPPPGVSWAVPTVPYPPPMPPPPPQLPSPALPPPSAAYDCSSSGACGPGGVLSDEVQELEFQGVVQSVHVCQCQDGTRLTISAASGEVDVSAASLSATDGGYCRGVIGGIACILLLVGGLVFWRRRKKRGMPAEPSGLKDEEAQVFADCPPIYQGGPSGFPLDSAPTDSALFSIDPYSWSTAASSIAAGSKATSGMPPTPELGSNASAVEAGSRGDTGTGGTGASSVPPPRSGASNRQDQIMAALLAGVWDIDLSEIKLGRMIGKGSYGKVFLGRWNETAVAVKRLDDLEEEGPESSQALVAALKAEAGLMASMRHPNIVQFMGMSTHPPAIVTEYCSRGSLTDVLRAGKRDPASLPWPLRLRMATEAALGMHHLHSQTPPILHRDLKSPNLLVDAEGHIRVADFNLSKIMHDSMATLSSNKTMAAMNPRWLAPEVLGGGKASIQSDCFAFGVVLWEILTCEVPWAAEPAFRVMSLVMMEGARPPVPPPAALPGGGFAGLPAYEALMRRCWAQAPSDRPQSFAEVISELRDIPT